MGDDLQRRVARVIVRAQHPGVPQATLDRLVDELDIGMPLARLIINELGLSDEAPQPAQPTVDLLVTTRGWDGPPVRKR